MKTVLLLVFVVSLLLLGCSVTQAPVVPTLSTPVEQSYDSCTADSDCVCGGMDKFSGRCFLGNKDYYEKNVDKSKQCPDFCNGIGGNLVVKCVDNKCIQMYGCIADYSCNGGKCVNNKCVASASSECSSDSECSKQGCSGQLCSPKSAGSIATTCEYRAEYDCLKMIDCGCTGGKCNWKTTPKYDACVDKAKSSVDGPV